MTDPIVSFGVQKIWELITQEYERLSGVREQITELKADLDILMCFLTDADARKQTTALARKCVDEVKEITYDAEDIIETYLLKGERSESSGIKNYMKSLHFQFVRRDTAFEIASISKRITKVVQVMRDFGIQSNIIEGGYSQFLQDRKREARHTFSSQFENNLVGLEKNVKRLVEELVENDLSHGVSITGLGGLGKTTLARQIFNHDTVKRHFDGLAWVCVSQDFTRKDVWQTILGNLSPGDKESNLREDEIQKKLFNLLETKKALIVLDDLWKKEDWDRIKLMFPERKVGWKVLLTSRNDAIHPHCMTFKPELLTHDECWKLLQKIAFPKNDTTTGPIIDEEMIGMAKEMVKQCGGLPLAVKLLGGLLASQHTSRQWKLISENIKSHILGLGGVSSTVEDMSSVNYILSLSFEGLPSYLKQCLLYLASFPEDYEIEIESLSYVWAAEGITKSRHYEGATIRDVADLYIEELVMRNMVISKRSLATSRFETCQLHDLMREICLLKAKEENFLQIVSDPTSSSNGHSQGSSKSRRLVVDSRYVFYGKREIKNSKLRSLLFIPVWDFELGSNIVKLLPLLRVLDLCRVIFKGGKLPSSIGKLIHLKYLSICLAQVTHLPSSLRKLKSLLYLNIDASSRKIIVPNVFKEMLELKYLSLPNCQDCQTKLELGNLLNLESLHNFSTKHSSVTDLHRMTRLRSLHIDIWEDVGGKEENIFSTLSHFGKLEDLTVTYCEYANRLKHQKLPDVQHLPSHLTTITLEEVCLEEDPMPILEKLIQLKTVSLHGNAYVGRRMVCSDGGFPQLQILKLESLPKLEEWIVEEGSMPLLHTLEILSCDKLKKLPDGLRFITSLKELSISTYEREFREKVSKGGEDYYKIQHIPLIQYSGWKPEAEDNEGN